MDVKYIPADWDQMKSSLGNLIGLGGWGKGMIDELKEVTRNLEDAKSDIDRYDSDGVVNFSHIDRESKYQEIFEDFKVMHDFTGKVGDIVDRTIDQPFYEDIDAFVSAMQQATISNYTTKNRLGVTDEVTYYAQGMNYTTRTPKAEVSLDDLLSGDNFYATQMNIEYDMWKAENPEQDFSQEEYRMAAVNMNAFEYNSIEDQQLNKEFWVNIAALVTMVGATVLAVVVPPVGVPLALTIGATYGALELGTAVTGKDWVSGRELGTGERWMRGLLSPLDIVPGVAGLKRFGTGIRLSNQVVDLGQMAVKPGLKSTIKKEIVHVGDMINTAGKMTVQRVKSAGLAVKDAANVTKNKLASDLQDLGRVADSAIMSAKNITSTRKVVLAGDIGKVHIPAENTRFFENKVKQMYSKTESVHVGGTKGAGNVRHLDDVPRISEIEVNFKRNIKHDPEEFARQIIDQEKGMNELTIDDYLKNRERYIAEGRALEGNVAQQTAREEAFSDKLMELMADGKSFDKAEKEAREWLNTQAALHNPDQIAGGKPDLIGGMGHKGINSSIGSQWRYRIDVVDDQIREMAKNMTQEQLKNTYLNVKLSH